MPGTKASAVNHGHPPHGPELRQRWWKKLRGLNRIVIKHEPFEHYFFRYYLLKNGWDAMSAVNCPTNLTHPLGLARYFDLSIMCTTTQNFRCALWLIFGSIMVAKKGPRALWVFTVVFLTLFYLLYCTAKWSSGVLLHSTNLQSLAMLGYMFVHLYYAWIDFRRWWGERQKRSNNPHLPITKEEFAQREETYEDDLSVAVVQQVTACGYFMSAITKVLHSGTWWKDINQVVYIAKANAQAMSTEKISSNNFAEWFIDFSLSYPTFVSFAFLGAFSIEVLSLLGFVWNRVLLFLGGIALHLLHYGIKVLMRIDLPGFRPLVDGFFLNPAYWTVMILLKLCDHYAPHIRLPFATDQGTHKTKWTWLLGQRRKVRSFLAFPLWPALIVCTLCLYFGENYPFTPFGMYSSPKGSNWYYSITDGNNRGLRTLPVLGVTAGKLKKLQWSTNGKDILEYFIHNAPPESQLRKQPDSIRWPMKLWKVNVHLQDMPDGSKQLIWDPPLLMEAVNLTATTPEFQTEVLYRRLTSKEKEALGLLPKEPETPMPTRTREGRRERKERRRERKERGHRRREERAAAGKRSGDEKAKRRGDRGRCSRRSKRQKKRERRKRSSRQSSSITLPQ